MDAKSAIYRFCNYQERCHREVREKLYELGCRKYEVEELVTELIEQGLLNEERYARAIARGKFRMKQWGRIKIVQQLKLNHVSTYCIKKALTEIDANEYYTTLEKLTAKKWEELRAERSPRIRQAKVFRYLLQKGYESNLIQEVINELISNQG